MMTPRFSSSSDTPQQDILPFDAWLIEQAGAYARIFSGSMRAKGVWISAEDQEDLAGEYIWGALVAQKAGISEDIPLKNAGRRAAYALLEEWKGWREFRRWNPKISDDIDESSKALEDVPWYSSNTEAKQIFHAQILDDYLNWYPDGKNRDVLLHLRGVLDARKERTMPEDEELAESFGMETEKYVHLLNSASESILAMMRNSIKTAPSHPDAPGSSR